MLNLFPPKNALMKNLPHYFLLFLLYYSKYFRIKNRTFYLYYLKHIIVATAQIVNTINDVNIWKIEISKKLFLKSNLRS